MSFTINDYMAHPTSSYPPKHWTFIQNRQPKPSQASSKIWAEMTTRYEQSMAQQQHILASNRLSETATTANIPKMDPSVQRKYQRQTSTAIKDVGHVYVVERAKDFIKDVDGCCENALSSIPEEDTSNTTDSSSRQVTDKERIRMKEAVVQANNLDELRYSNDIERCFRKRLDEIYSAYYEFICTPAGKPRPKWAKLCRMAKEVVDHVSRVEQQTASDVAELREFLRGQLFDQYCLMRATPMERKEDKWLKYGECIIKGYRGDPQVTDRLDRTIDAAGLNDQWVMERIQFYSCGTDHIGQWQGYAKECRWGDLAQKLMVDLEQLEIINSSNANWSKRCKIVSNIRNTQRRYFIRLDGGHDFELSEHALRLEREKDDSSSSSSASEDEITGEGPEGQGRQ